MRASVAASAPVLSIVSPETAPTSNPWRALESEIAARFVERADVIRALCLAFISGHHAILLGPPGTAKSAIVRAFVEAFGGPYFEYLMAKGTEPSEIFGGLDVPELQKSGTWRRKTTGKLPEALVAFLDETMKGNSAILNTLLTITNERKYHTEAGPIDVPLSTLIGASNELPEDESLAAMWDRFMIRAFVSYIKEDDNFRKMLESVPTPITVRIDLPSEVAAARAVLVSPETLDTIVALRAALGKEGIAVSDRRWRQSLDIIRASAHLDGRTVTEPEDVEALEHVLWSAPDQRTIVARVVQSVIAPDNATAVTYLDDARGLLASLPANSDPNFLPKLSLANADVGRILARFASLRPSRKVDQCRAEIETMKKDFGRMASAAMGMKL